MIYDNDKFTKQLKTFLNAIGGVQIADDRSFINEDCYMYAAFEFNGNEEIFCGNIPSNRYDATLNKIYIDKDKRGYPLDELINFYTAKIDLLNSEYKDLLLKTDMEFGKDYVNGFNVIGWRKKMSYSSNFKHSDIFTQCSVKLVKFINENSQLEECRRCWQSTEDSNILLVSSLGFNFLILIDDLAESLHTQSSEITKLI